MGKFVPKTEGRVYTLGGYKFKVYSIMGYDFMCDIDVSSANGVYCFTKIIYKDTVGREKKEFKRTHHLLYLGKADGEEGLNGRLVHTHEKFTSLKQDGAQFLSIYECSPEENPKDVESGVLAAYNFQFNVEENKDTNNLPISVTED